MRAPLAACAGVLVRGWRVLVRGGSRLWGGRRKVDPPRLGPQRREPRSPLSSSLHSSGTRASGRARAGRATRAVRVAALPRGGAGQPWRTVGPGPRLVRFSAVEPEQASLGDRLLLIVLGALFAFVFSMAIQLWIVPRVERRKRREERWERDVLALGELLTAEVPALATAAQRDAYVSSGSTRTMPTPTRPRTYCGRRKRTRVSRSPDIRRQPVCAQGG